MKFDEFAGIVKEITSSYIGTNSKNTEEKDVASWGDDLIRFISVEIDEYAEEEDDEDEEDEEDDED